jgi:hypothetical protein
MSELETRTGRDTRLLALVIVIAVAVLFGLAQFRYPATEAAPTPPTPLARLAASGTYDDLGAAMRAALQAAQPSIMTIALDADEASQKDKEGRTFDARSLAVRLGADSAVVHVPAGVRLPAAAAEFILERFDSERRVAFIAVPSAAGGVAPMRPAADFTGFAYVAVVEAALGGPTARPLFIGRIDPIPDAEWNGTVLASLELANLPAGALMFTLDGRFIGLVIDSGAGARVIVPPPVLDALRAGPPGGPGDAR